MTTYTKTPVSEKPEKADWYFTEHEKLKPTKTIQYWDGDMWLSKEITHWLKPVPPEAISMEEAKEQVLKEIGVDTWKELIEERQEYYVDECEKKAGDIFLQQNTAALREELESLRKENGVIRMKLQADREQNIEDAADGHMVFEDQNNTIVSLQQLVKTLRELLSLSREHYIRMTNPLLSRSHNRDHEFIKRVDVALSNTNQS